MRLTPPAAPGFVPLGDQAVLATFADENAAARFARAVGPATFSWVVDVVPAYASVAVFYDPDAVGYRRAAEQLAGFTPPAGDGRDGASFVVPCCYEMGPDLARVAEHMRGSTDAVATLHGSVEYRVFAVGFCPGFPYLGYLPDALAGVPRLPSPRPRVPAGSIGLTGRQTGIYTEERPGGWNLVGRTPLELVNVADGYFPLRTGDRVRFRRIDEAEFGRLRGERL